MRSDISELAIQPVTWTLADFRGKGMRPSDIKPVGTVPTVNDVSKRPDGARCVSDC
jgi:hypothetical protein